MTGRGAGYCSGSPVPGYMDPIPGRGVRGGGRGWRHRFYATGVPGRQRAGRGLAASRAIRRRENRDPAPLQSSVAIREQEIELLRHQAEALKDTLEDITSRIEQLEAAPPVADE